MTDEILIEEGIVISTSEGFAEINISRSDSCEECSAKIICKPNGKDKQLIKVIDPFGTLPGDRVKIRIKGSDLLIGSFFLYGLPLLILLSIIISFVSFLKDIPMIEIYSVAAAVIVLAVYYLMLVMGKINLLRNKYAKIASVIR